MKATCPNCGHRIPRPASPAAQVVTGAAGPDVAPVLHAAWTAILRTVRADPSGQVPLASLVEKVTAAADCAPSTVSNLVAAAAHAGVLQRRYVRGGAPVRVRCYVGTAGAS